MLRPGLTTRRSRHRWPCSRAGGLVLDLDREYRNITPARALAERHPELVVVLEQIGFPRSRDSDHASAWRSGMVDLAAAPNVVCKISGAAVTDPLFTLESLAPWVRHCLETFGPSRCTVGSNWPLDRLCSTYDVIMVAYRDCAAKLTADEQRRGVVRNDSASLRARPGRCAPAAS